MFGVGEEKRNNKFILDKMDIYTLACYCHLRNKSIKKYARRRKCDF